MTVPTPRQALLLFGLLARHGECKQAELVPGVFAKDREALVKAKLISVEKIGRGLSLRLEDAGWGWAGGHLSTELPPAQLALADLLKRLNEHLARSGETLADFIGSKPEEPGKRLAPKAAPSPKSPAKAKTAPKVKAAPKIKAAPKPKAPTAAALRKRIEQVYLELTGGKKNESVRLAQLRDKLSGLDRATVDAALGRILKSDKKASLIRQDDPRRIGKADDEAAYSPAGEPFHILWIAS